MSEDDDGDSDGKPKERAIPPTRRHESVQEPKGGTRYEVPWTVGLGGALVLVGVMLNAIAFRGTESISIFGIVAVVVGVTLFAVFMKKVRIVAPNVVAQPEGEAPVRQSYTEMMNAKVEYPDDDKMSAVVRSSDEWLGKIEQMVLVLLLFSVLMIASISTLADKIADAHPFGHFKDDAIRGGTFSMALLGAAFAMHQGRHLSMDLISRRLKPRARLMLKIALALFVIFIVLVMIRSGFHTIVKEEEFKTEDKLITPVRLAYMVPIGGALIIIHTFLHSIIDLSYIARRKTPPEKMRTGH